MRLIADTLGPMIPSTYFNGNVHSIFERLVNVKLQDGSFISICRNDVPNGPGIIRCRANNKFSYEDYLRTGEICAYHGGILRIGQNFQVDLRYANRWQRRIDSFNTKVIYSRWSIYRNNLYESNNFNRVNDIIGNPSQYFDEILNMGENLSKLVGKGPGLTPLGDDFIVGVAAGMESHAVGNGLLADWLLSIHSKTTDLSSRALFYAACGWFTEPLIDFVNSIFSTKTETDPTKLLSIGDTSGTAMAYGCLLGIHAGTNITLQKPYKTRVNKNSLYNLKQRPEIKVI